MDCDMKEDPSMGMKIALLLLMVVMVYLFCVTFLPMTDDGADMAKTIVPFLLGSVVGTLIGFYWGNKHKQAGEEEPPSPATESHTQVMTETKVESVTDKKPDSPKPDDKVIK